MKKTLFSALLSLFFLLMSAPFACKSVEAEAGFSLEPAFYHWKNLSRPSAEEWRFSDETGAKRLYFHVFDVIWASDGPTSVVSLGVDTLNFSIQEVVPVVYITEQVFKNIRPENVDDLVEKVLTLLTDFFPNWRTSAQFSELQFDCDWAEKSKAEYFLFLSQIKSKVPQHLHISATIRLHQVKFFEKTGVPPCDRGMLMVYNTGEIKNIDEENSILTEKAALDYLLPTREYPLPLDVALPIFDWMVLYRDSSLFKIVYPPELEAVADSNFFEKLDSNHWRVLKPVQFAAFYLHPGDILRAESAEMHTIDVLLPKIRPYLGRNGRHILAFYHLDAFTINKHQATDLSKLVQVLAKMNP